VKLAEAAATTPTRQRPDEARQSHMFHSREKIPTREIYCCGGGLLVASINSPDCLVTL